MLENMIDNFYSYRAAQILENFMEYYTDEQKKYLIKSLKAVGKKPFEMCLELFSDEEKFENLIKAINNLKATVGIKQTIKDYNIDENDFLNRLDDMTEQAFDDQCTGANPRYPLMSELKEMYLNSYYGKHFKEKAMPVRKASKSKK